MRWLGGGCLGHVGRRGAGRMVLSDKCRTQASIRVPEQIKSAGSNLQSSTSFARKP